MHYTAESSTLSHRATQLTEELSAVPTGGSRHGQFDQLQLPMLQGVDHQKLLSVNRVVQGEAGKLQVHPHVQATAGAQAYTPAGQEACNFDWLAPTRMASPWEAIWDRIEAPAAHTDAAEEAVPSDTWQSAIAARELRSCTACLIAAAGSPALARPQAAAPQALNLLPARADCNP